MTTQHPCWRTRPLRWMVSLLLPLTQGVPVSPVLAQTVAPNAAPQGGRVVGGAAGISQTSNATVINQSSNRAIVNWQSFNVGQNQTVQFQQPSTQSTTLNRVTSPDPSVIAGHITANGGVALVNQSGVFFAHGAQVQAQSVIVSTADISNRNFMAGGAMSFDRAGKPDAQIVNNGSITVRQAGLAALVAPQVANHGVIQAHLGTVVLAGAERHVIDLNGDGLVSFDVTDAVQRTPNNGQALVTNTGVIRADGGTVQLTAAAADGVVQDLVRAGGRIRANTDVATGRPGRILLEGTGGSISVAGDISAQGRTAGTHGGTIGVLADRVQVESTARINASGSAGGGTIALGTSLPGAATQRLAQGTGIAKGAVIKANAIAQGNGGHVVVNASQQTAVAGNISVRGGRLGGDGGMVELSSQGSFALSGLVDAGAPAGRMGSVVLDPATLTVVADNDPRANVTNGELTSGTLSSGTDPGADDFITPSQIAGITGALTLQATNSIEVGAAVTKPLGDLNLQSGGSLTIDAPITLGNGNLQLAGNIITINSVVTVPTANQVLLTPGTNLTEVFVPATVTEGTGGAISAGTLTQSAGFGTIDLQGANTIQTIGRLTATTVSVVNTTSLDVTDAVLGVDTVSIRVNGANLTIDGTIGTSGENPTTQLFASGNVTIGANATVRALNLQIAAGYNFTTNAPDPTAAGGIFLSGQIFGATNGEGGATIASPIALSAGLGGITQTGGLLQATTLTVQSGGNVTLASIGETEDVSNAINVLGASTVQGNFTLAAYTLPIQSEFPIQGTLILAGDIKVSGALNLQAINASLLEQDGARVLASTLVATADGGIAMQGQNQVNLIDTMSGDGISFHNVTDLQIGGPVTSPADVTIATDGNLVISGNIAVQNSDLLLQAGGNLSVTASGTLSAVLNDGFGASITLEAAAPTAGFNAALPGSMSLAGAITAANGITLDAGTGGVSQTQGNIGAQTLVVQSGGDAFLDRGGTSGGTPNSITGAIAATVAGDFEFDNGMTDITIPGAINAGAIGLRTTGTLALTSSCPITPTDCIPSTGSLNAGSGRVSLRVGDLALAANSSITGGLVEIGSAAQEPLVAGDPDGSVIAGSFMVNQDVLSKITSTTLRVGADTFRGTTSVTATQLTLGGPITLPNALDLRSLGDITQAAEAAFTVGTISGAGNGNVVLTLGTNSAESVGDLSAGNALNLTLSGSMSIAGTVSGTEVTLISAVDMTETGSGNVVADQLTLTATNGLIGLAGANVVTQLNASTAGTALAFNDVAPTLTVSTGNTIQAGAALTLVNSGDLTIDGTATGATTTLRSGKGTLTVNGHSAIARTGVLVLSAPTVLTNGLISSADEIVIAANSATLGGEARGLILSVQASPITFNALDARTMQVLLFPGTNGTVTGSLDAAGLQINGGGSTRLTGSLAGITTGTAAATGVRATTDGVRLGDPPSNANKFTFNGCPIGVAVCSPAVIVSPPPPVQPPPPDQPPPAQPPSANLVVNPPVGVASAPEKLLSENNPRRFDASLTDNWLILPTPPAIGLSLQPTRDPGEDLELAPPNIRAEDF